jgi:uncharacterized protein YraI
METPKSTNLLDFGHPRSRRFLNQHRNILFGFCLVFAAITSGACAVAPALMLTSAAITAAAVVTEGERIMQPVNEPNSVIVENETDVYAGPGEDYSHKGTLGKGDRIEVLGYQEEWIQCRSDQFEMGWIRDSDVPDI